MIIYFKLFIRLPGLIFLAGVQARFFGTVELFGKLKTFKLIVCFYFFKVLIFLVQMMME